jgi:transcription elongation factor Elf1
MTKEDILRGLHRPYGKYLGFEVVLEEVAENQFLLTITPPKISSCPFCGGKARECDIWEEEGGLRMICDDCGSFGPVVPSPYQDYRKAIQEWNKTYPRVPVMIEDHSLLSCPFCKSKKMEIFNEDDGDDRGRDHSWVECEKCLSQTDWLYGVENAVNAWNRTVLKQEGVK